jgi:hypothetical protein
MNATTDEIAPLEADELQLPSLGLAARRYFIANGYLRLDDLWLAGFAAALADEAHASHAHAQIPESGPRTPVEERRLLRRQTRAASGALLSRLHVSMIGVARTISGRLVVPTFSAYGYYEGDDEVLLHTDSDLCDVTLITTALGSVGALHLRPELRGESADVIGALEMTAGWDNTGGTPVVYPDRGLLALAGNSMPHNRPPHPVAELCAVAALCYRSLL